MTRVRLGSMACSCIRRRGVAGNCLNRFVSLDGGSAAERGQQRVGEQQQQRDGHADHRHGVEQAGDDEHLHLQHRGQFRLAGRAFEELAAEDGKTNCGTEGAQADQQASGDDGELDSVKKDALEQLRPLIEKLDLEPADKFDKYLMMLRASDDPALIKPAFEAAQGIPGEKEKAQALLDIINEINYITASKQQ